MQKTRFHFLPPAHPSLHQTLPALGGVFVEAHLLAGVPLPTLMVDFLVLGHIGDFRHLTSPPISRLVSIRPIFSLSTFDHFPPYDLYTKRCAFQNHPQEPGGLDLYLCWRWLKSAKRFFCEVEILRFGKKCLNFQQCVSS